MSPRALGRTWDEASSPEVLRLAGRFEAAWRDSSGARPDPSDHLPSDPRLRPAALLALLRTDLALRWQDGEAVAVEWYLRRHPDLGPETLMALAYEEFCLRAEAGERPDPAEYQARFPEVAAGLREVLDIHDLVVGAAGSSTALIGPSPSAAALPAAGQTIAGFHLVEELGRGAFARVFLAHERQLADRPVALKVTRLGSREPQTLAQLQHTHIVPVHSYRTDPATGLHLLCMPYFGHVTLAQILAETGLTEARSGSDLLAALDRLQGHRGFTAETAEIAERKTEAIRERKDEAIEKKRKGEFVGRNRTRILLRSHSLSFRSVFLSAFSASSAVKSSHVSGTSREVLAGRTYARVVAWLGARLAEALAHAHERGVLHRDVKPTNILVTADGLPMLLDFNLAHDPRDGAGGDGVRLGGTLAYMAPEHLEAMIAGEAEGIDHRADLYALGMVLFEALGGHPMSSASFAAGGAAAFDAVRRLLAARRAGPPRLPEGHPGIPAEFATVLRRCLAPDPAGRHASAADLAADLQAVADDAPLRIAREPVTSRSVRWLRRNRGRLALTAPILLALALFNLAQFRAQAERIRREAESRRWSGQAEHSLATGELGAAAAQFATAAELIGDRPDLRALRDGLIGRRREAMEAREIRAQADALSRAAEPLRFRLLGFGGDRGSASRDLAAALEPFGVLTDPSWTHRPGLQRLDEGRRDRLFQEIDELLFIWVVALATDRLDDPEMARRAAGLCERAPAAADTRPAWLALRAGWQGRLVPAPVPLPVDRTRETSARACFQRSLLATLGRDRAAARAWLERATRLRPDHYWSWFALAYHDAAAGDLDGALARYDVAVALRPDSPWARFNRAQLYVARGAYARAREDLDRALQLADDAGFDQAEALVERGRLRQAIGDVVGARADFDAAIASNPAGRTARAARLDRAKLAADAGLVAQARAAYDALLAEDSSDRPAHLGRALLRLQGGQAVAAEADLDRLLRDASSDSERAQLLALRATARLVLARPEIAAADAAEALRLEPGPGAVRLWARAELAAGRVPVARLLLPEEIDRWIRGGPPLVADLQRAVEHLRSAGAEGEGGSDLTLALLLDALADHAAALSVADRAVAAALDPLEALAVRARLRGRAGELPGARADVDRALILRPDDPGLLELRGRLEIAAGRLEVGLADLDRALCFGAGGSARAERARVGMALDRPEEALDDWSRVVADAPDDPDALLGRARAFVRLRLWDQALADLERAAGRSAPGSPGFGRITRTYAACLLGRPDRLPRVFALALRWGLARFVPAP